MATLLDTRDLKERSTTRWAGRSFARWTNTGNDSEGMLAAGVPMPFWLTGVTISLIAGSYPAARAARLDPIRAVRHD
jgi:hypothetical protein